MLEGLVAEVLASTLGSYLDVTKDKLRISLWQGRTSLSQPACLWINTRQYSHCWHGISAAARLCVLQGRVCWKM